ncbi:MAG TPA: 2-oxo acid dehydrogenase subunit E2, partial [Candidatus Limnocylindria bacterium]|nr:2-oxo acid dehydrogenase subunit E2 [Candidatus Limnocylindria bacterium]
MPPSDPPQSPEVEQTLDAVNAVNAGYVAELYEQFRRDPASVDGEWRALFESRAVAPPTSPAAPPAAPSENGQEATAAAPPPAPTKTSPPAPAETPAPARAMEPEPPAEPALPPGATPIKGPASRLARNMTASLAVPTATSFRDVPVVTLAAMRTGLNEQLAPRKISFTHLIGWAIVRAAGDAPAMTNYFHESDGAAYRVDPGGVNLGLAVDVERPDGSRLLVVPVIKGADGMDFADFVGRYEDLVERARSNGLSPDDMAGATITLTNPGTLGTTASVPRLMPNQGAIVATGAIRETGAGRVMTITSTYDHRVIQGAESGSFLRQIDGLLAGAGDFYPDVFSSLAADFAKAP